MRTDLPPDFIAAAYMTLRAAQSAGEELVTHCLHCGKCVHKGDDDLSVIMCPVAMELNRDWERKLIAGKIYAKLVGLPEHGSEDDAL
jgi:hypothetical protein